MTKKEFLSRWTVLQPIYEVKKGETVKHSMEDDLKLYATEFGKFLLENAMFQQRGKLYLKFTDKEIDEIIKNALNDFENK